MAAQTVLEELTSDVLTAEHVRERLDDWSKRLDALFSLVESWLPSGWHARRGPVVRMREGLMTRTGVPERVLPTLELVRDSSVLARLRPYGLWIVGANGRVDLVKGRELYIVVDRARTFEAADWHIASAAARSADEPFDRERLLSVLGQ